MATELDVIYCASGNAIFAQTAIDAGMLYGAQLPSTVYYPVHFADQNWKNPDREKYMAELLRYRPAVATVLDLEHSDQLPEVLSWAEEAAQYAATVMIIPKVFGIIARLPRRIGGADVRLGYSVPTRHGGTEVPVWEFFGWPVHLLGGSPHAQMRLARIAQLDVVSVDGNMMNKMATTFCSFWENGTARYAKDRYWPSLKESRGGVKWDRDNAPAEAFRRSCENIISAWREL